VVRRKLLVYLVASASQRYVLPIIYVWRETPANLSQQCDGGRPSCKCCISKATTCNYSVITPGVTQQQAIKNELDAYKRVLTLIRDSSPADAEALVKIIKDRDSLGHAVQDIQAMTTRQNETEDV
jgi:hypothetical protein